MMSDRQRQKKRKKEYNPGKKDWEGGEETPASLEGFYLPALSLTFPRLRSQAEKKLMKVGRAFLAPAKSLCAVPVWMDGCCPSP